MKNFIGKILIVILSAGCVFQADAIIGPMRAVRCLFDPKTKCDAQTMKEARMWAAATSAATIATIAAAVGIAVTGKKVQEAQRAQDFTKQIEDLDEARKTRDEIRIERESTTPPASPKAKRKDDWTSGGQLPDLDAARSTANQYQSDVSDRRNLLNKVSGAMSNQLGK